MVCRTFDDLKSVLLNRPLQVPLGESIASEGKGEYMYVEGYVRDTNCVPIPGAVIYTWETDDKGV